jgi:hypothetical protein
VPPITRGRQWVCPAMEGVRMPARRMPGRVKGTPAADAINGMTDSQLLCRDFGHSWRPYTAEWIPQRRHYVETLMCQRCRTARLRLLDEYGSLLANRYQYEDGYLIHGVGRLTGDDRDALRLAGLRAVMRATDESATKSRRLRAVGE